MALTSGEANDIDANSPKNPVRKRGGRLQKRYDPTTGGGKHKLSANDHFSWTVFFSLELQAGSNAGSLTCLATRRRWKDKLDDEIKQAGFESMAPK